MRLSRCDFRYCIVIVTLLSAATGCAGHSRPKPATKPATDIPLATTQPSYWLDQPANATVRSPDFKELWRASEDAALDFLFKIDRTDYRAGLLTTVPLVSAQWFEFWRPDTQTTYDRTESSLATIRRTIRFEFTRLNDGTFEMVPKVLVERQAVTEQRITSVVLYRSAFVREIEPRYRQTGTRESDVGVILPPKYWYPIRRDADLERAVAGSVEKKVKKLQAGAVTQENEPGS